MECLHSHGSRVYGFSSVLRATSSYKRCDFYRTELRMVEAKPGIDFIEYGDEILATVTMHSLQGLVASGAVGILAEHLFANYVIKGTFPIINASGQPCKPGALLASSVKYTPVDQSVIYCGGVGSDPEFKSFPGSYCPVRRGGKVTLFWRQGL
ncbi:hypothetical protein L1987_02456 [Smallanthus sonchifolius]|uniref:Uncharacterized protein n=1 Tax=Smallanthus sonchifolius TaxID=185202 RepID=A0ACB9K811_9ASTR|nr:hypothetical protein L1987_02456 [Smallanthus sonchifolius]